MSLSTFSYCSCGLSSSVIDVGESTTSSPGISIQEAGGFFCYVFASLRSSRQLPFPSFEPSWARQARTARNLYSAPAYTSKAREKRPGEEVAAYAKNAHGFASPPACVASFSDEKEEYFHFLPIIGHVRAIFFVLPMDHQGFRAQLSSFPVFLRQKAWLLIHHGGFRGLEYQVKRKKNLTG